MDILKAAFKKIIDEYTLHISCHCSLARTHPFHESQIFARNILVI